MHLTLGVEFLIGVSERLMEYWLPYTLVPPMLCLFSRWHRRVILHGRSARRVSALVMDYLDDITLSPLHWPHFELLTCGFLRLAGRYQLDVDHVILFNIDTRFQWCHVAWHSRLDSDWLFRPRCLHQSMLLLHHVGIDMAHNIVMGRHTLDASALAQVTSKPRSLRNIILDLIVQILEELVRIVSSERLHRTLSHV